MNDESSLDPTDWNAFSKLAHATLDRMLNELRQVADRPVWQPLPAEVRQRIQTRLLPRVGIGEAAAVDTFFEDILPFPNGSWHPRFLGWVQGTGMPLAMLADMLASGLNAHLAGFDQAPPYVELQVIRWIAEMLGWPADAGGLLTSGGTMANLLGLAIARHHAGESGQSIIYCSDQTHGWIDKSVELMGIGASRLRKIPSRQDGTLDLQLLEAAIREDLQQARVPLCVCANVGTVHFGAIDPLEQLADLCARHNIWLHLDGAFGALAYLVDEYQPILSAMRRADSLAVDLHKWIYLPFDIGVILVRDVQCQLDTFSQQQSYMQATDRGLLAGGVPLADRGIELSRSFRALKVWICFLAYGADRFAACIRMNIEQARYFAQEIQKNTSLELSAPVPLNIVCFRFIGQANDLAELNALNQELLLRLQESGEAVISSTWLDNSFVLRAAITNHRTRFSDLDRILASVITIGRDLQKKGWRE